jgi:hypothetical protein
MPFVLLSRSRSKPAPKQKSARAQHPADSRFGFAKPVFQPQIAALPTAPAIQTKLKIGESNDKFEQEADRVLELQENRNGSLSPSAAAQRRGPVGNLQGLYGNRPVLQMRNGSGGPTTPSVPLRSNRGGILQRKCACGGAAGMQGECEECGKKKRLGLQTKLKVNEPGDSYEREANRVADQVLAAPAHSAVSGAPLRIQRFAGQATGQMDAAPASVDHALASPGRSLEPALRQDMEQRFGYDFSQVRVHSGATAEQSARDVNANAYTVGHNIVFGASQFAPETHEGRRLIAHELTHVVQQSGADGIYTGQVNEKRGLPSIASGHTDASGDGGQPSVQRKPESKESGPDRARNHKNVRMHFDGRDLIVYADENEVFRWSAQSGRPVPLDPKDVAACGADPVTETYMNNPRFVGITEFGPTPEATYQFRAAGIEHFSPEQEHTLRWKSHEFILRTPFGSVSGGDWGNGRVELRPVDRPKEGPCGNASKRSGFFMHGGVLAGSSGCIDIGDNHFSELAEWLQGYPRPITLTVKYEHPAPAVGTFTGISGMLAYGHERFSHQPRLAFGKETTATGESRSVTSGTYDIIMQWAGGALAAGLRLDVSLSGKDTFVRGGLSSETNFRLFRALYGRLSVGYLQPLSGRGTIGGLEVGGGLEYDFGPVQLEAIYDLIAPMSNDNRTQQVLFGIGIRR